MYAYYRKTKHEYIECEYKRADAESVDKKPFGYFGSDRSSGVFYGIACFYDFLNAAVEYHALVGGVV